MFASFRKIIANPVTNAAVAPAPTNSYGTNVMSGHLTIPITASLARNTNATILVWNDSAPLKSIDPICIRVVATGEIIPLGAVDQNTHSLMTITTDSSNQQIVKLNIPNATGIVIPANSEIYCFITSGVN